MYPSSENVICSTKQFDDVSLMSETFNTGLQHFLVNTGIWGCVVQTLICASIGKQQIIAQMVNAIFFISLIISDIICFST